ncbi:MAG: hypothetical protein PHC31_02095 [Clostridia bacterium]|jgi:hypothetical protein|nr:hypothetical protein [Clostridia bacterium]MDD3970684.1 hypothetical protein [Clostridia bacterium]
MSHISLTAKEATCLCAWANQAEYIKSIYVLRYALTSRQKQLLSLFDMNVTDVTDMVKTLDFTRKELNP